MFEATRDIRFGIEVDTRGLSRGLGNAQRQVSNFARQSASSFGGLEKSAGKFMKGMIAPVAGFFVAQTVFRMAKQVADLDAKLVRIGIDGNLTAKQTAELKDQIFSLGISSGAGTEKMVELSSAAMDAYKDFGLVTKNLGFMTTVMQASGASAKDVGEYFGKLSENAKMSDTDIEALTARLYAFGKSQNRELKFGQVMGQVPTMVRQARMMLGKDASVKAIGDFIVTNMFTGSPNAMRMAQRMMLKKSKVLSDKLGFDLSKGMPSVSQVAMKIIATSKNAGDAAGKMYEAFGRGSAELVKLWTEQDAYNAALGRMGDIKKIYEDADKERATLNSGLKAIDTIITQLSDATLGPMLGEIAKGLSDISPSDIKAIADAFGWLGNKIAFVVKGYLLLPGFFKELAGMAQEKKDADLQLGLKTGMNAYEVALMQEGDIPQWMAKRSWKKRMIKEGRSTTLNEAAFNEPSKAYDPINEFIKRILGVETPTAPGPLSPGAEKQPGYVPYTINLEAKTYLDGVSLPSKTTVTSTNDRQFTMMSGGR